MDGRSPLRLEADDKKPTIRLGSRWVEAPRLGGATGRSYRNNPRLVERGREAQNPDPI